MVTPSDLLDVAVTLSGIEGEAYARRSVSTAYYAAYHHCAGLLGRGWRPNDHRNVRRATRRRHPGAADDLLTLRDMRLAADYRLLDPFDYPAVRACDLARGVLAVS